MFSHPLANTATSSAATSSASALVFKRNPRLQALYDNTRKQEVGFSESKKEEIEDDIFELLKQMQKLGLTLDDTYIDLIVTRGELIIRDDIVKIGLPLSECLRTIRKSNPPHPFLNGSPDEKISYFRLLIHHVSSYPFKEPPEDKVKGAFNRYIKEILSRVNADFSKSAPGSSSGSTGDEEKATTPIVVPDVIIEIIQQAKLYNPKNIAQLRNFHFTYKRTNFLYEFLTRLMSEKPMASENHLLNQNNFEILIYRLNTISAIFQFNDPRKIPTLLLVNFIDFTQTEVRIIERINAEWAEQTKNNTPESNFDTALIALQNECRHIQESPLDTAVRKKEINDITAGISTELSRLRSNKPILATATNLLELITIGLENRGLSSEQQVECMRKVQEIRTHLDNDFLWLLVVRFLAILGIAVAALTFFAFAIMPAAYLGLAASSPMLELSLLVTVVINAVLANMVTTYYDTAIAQNAKNLQHVGLFANNIKINGKTPLTPQKTQLHAHSLEMRVLNTDHKTGQSHASIR